MQTDNEINPITPRANAKLVKVGNRLFLVGGLTTETVTNDIHEVRTLMESGQLKVEWKKLNFKNNVFQPCNSFSACGSNQKIYIWGGLQSKETEQTLLHSLIEVDIGNSQIIGLDKLQMRELVLKQPIKIHSSALMFDSEENQLIAIGGTNEFSTMESFLYTLKLGGEEYEWNKKKLDCQFHKGYLWQHTAHLSNFSYFNGANGKFITVIGGCHYPQSPYNAIVEFDLKLMKMSNSALMKMGLISHDSTASKQQIVVFGGSNGGGFNPNRVILANGTVHYSIGHNAIGCSCFQNQSAYYVIGGVSAIESLNAVIIYRKTQ